MVHDLLYYLEPGCYACGFYGVIDLKENFRTQHINSVDDAAFDTELSKSRDMNPEGRGPVAVRVNIAGLHYRVGSDSSEQPTEIRPAFIGPDYIYRTLIMCQ